MYGTKNIFVFLFSIILKVTIVKWRGRKVKVINMLTREELKSVHNNIMTIMENRIIQMTGCNRQTANLLANEILDLDREAETILSENEAVN